MQCIAGSAEVPKFPNPTNPTQTNTTTPQHHNTATQWGPNCKAAPKVPEKGEITAPKAPGNWEIGAEGAGTF
eukprot:gene11372-biopygen16861